MAKKKKDKIPHIGVGVPKPEKKARVAESALPDGSRLTSWSFANIDTGGGWPWANFEGQEKDFEAALHRFRDVEGMTWAELGGSGSHDVDLDKLIPEARARLKELKQEDVDSLYSLRVMGAVRVWGIRDRHVLRVLWWDPYHLVCPSLPR